MEKKPEFYTLQEAAEILGFSAQTVRRRTKAGELPAYRMGGRIRIKREDLEKYIEEMKEG